MTLIPDFEAHILSPMFEFVSAHVKANANMFQSSHSLSFHVISSTFTASNIH